MKVILQIVTLLVLAIDVASAVMLYWTLDSPGQDAAGRGMASGFLIMTLATMAASVLLLLFSYWSNSAWPVLLALIIAIVPLFPVVLPQLM